MSNNIGLDPKILNDLIKYRMPYGKYKNSLICNLPEYYLVWYNRKGFPSGKIGTLLATMYEIKLNGLEYLLDNLKSNFN